MNLRFAPAIALCATLGLLLSHPRPAQAQTTSTESASLTSAGSPGSVGFGAPLGVSGARLFVGAPRGDASVPGGGEVQVFQLGASPLLEALLGANDLATDDGFGSALDPSGETVAVGAPGHDAGGADAGAVYLFRWDGAAWILEQKLQAPSPETGAAFGTAVCLDGERLIVGESHRTVGSDLQRGRFYVFERSGGAWSQVFEASGNGSGADDRVGYAVALLDDVLAASALDASVQSEGAVYVYRRSAGGWAQEQKLTGSHPFFSTFGNAIQLVGNRLVVGDPYGGQNGGGLVHLFTHSGIAWSLEAELHTFYPAALDQLGVRVDLVGDRLLAAAPGSNIWGNFTGAAYLFEFDGLAWRETYRMITSTPTNAWFCFPNAVALVGEQVLLGAPCAGASPEQVLFYDLPPLVGTPLCAGDGTGSPCPCGNESDPAYGLGCNNGFDRGAGLWGAGSAGVAADDLRLTVNFTIHGPFPQGGQPVVLFAGRSALNGGLGTPFGDGLRCVGGQVRRLGTQAGLPTQGISLWGPGFAGQLGVVPGDTRHFQAWYRDSVASPCGQGFNTSNALGVVFAP